MTNSPTLNLGACVEFHTEILDANDQVISRKGPIRNLITNYGLRDVMRGNHSFRDSLQYCAVGTGTRPTKRDSGALTVTVSSGVAESSGAFFVAEDVGRLLKMDSGQESRIVTFTDSTHVILADDFNGGPAEFTVWYVNDYQHENEVLRFVEADQKTQDWDGVKATLSRRYLSGAFSAAKLLTEIGWSGESHAGANLFGRTLIPGGDLVGAGQKYRVTSTLYVTPSPLIQTDYSLSVPGFDASGKIIFSSIADLLQGFSRAGVFAGGLGFLEDATIDIGYRTGDFSLPVAPSTEQIWCPNRAGASVSFDDANLTKTITRTLPTTLNTTLYGFSCGDIYESLACKLTTPQSKSDLHDLTVGFSIKFGRILSNA